MPGRGEGLTIEQLWEAPESDEQSPHWRGGALPAELAARYPDELTVELERHRPTILANFVSSIDGVVALGRTERSTGGGEISGFSEPDRFVMSLLRGIADAVIVGAGTVRVGRNHEWTARHLQPGLAAVFARWRAEMGLAPQPTTVVVTASGELDPGHAGLRAPDVPVVVLTTTAGARRLTSKKLPPNLSVVVGNEGSRVTAQALTDALGIDRLRVALCEGGPHLMGELLAAQIVDQLFLTVAPQLIGRPGHLDRLGLVEGVDLMGAAGTWGKLTSIRRAGEDLFLRYRFDRPG